MILFLIGIVEMVIATFWTKSVAKANTAMTGAITFVNIFIWFYVIQQVVENLDNWTALVPYAAGCTIGAMLAAADYGAFLKKFRRLLALARRQTKGVRSNLKVPVIPVPEI